MILIEIPLLVEGRCPFPWLKVGFLHVIPAGWAVGVHPHVALSATRGRGSPFAAGFFSFWCQIFSHVLS